MIKINFWFQNLLSKLRIGENFLNMMKGIYQKPKVNFTLNDEGPNQKLSR